MKQLTAIAVIVVLAGIVILSVPFQAYGGKGADLVIKKVEEKGKKKVIMEDANGKRVIKASVPTGGRVEVDNELSEGNVILTVIKGGKTTFQTTLPPKTGVDLIVGSKELPAGAEYRVCGNPSIRIEGEDSNIEGTEYTHVFPELEDEETEFCTPFVIPESQIGIIAMIASSLAVLGYWIMRKNAISMRN